MRISSGVLTVTLCYHFVLSVNCAHLRESGPWTERDIQLNSDPSSQPSCNRAALETIAVRQERLKRDIGNALRDAWEGEDTCLIREREAIATLSRADWWQRFGPILVAVAGGLGLAIGVAGGIWARK